MVRRHRPTPERILRCPQCRSTDVFTDVTMFSGALYTCKQCGYKGPFILEEDVPSQPPPLPEGSSEDLP